MSSFFPLPDHPERHVAGQSAPGSCDLHIATRGSHWNCGSQESIGDDREPHLETVDSHTRRSPEPLSENSSALAYSARRHNKCDKRIELRVQVEHRAVVEAATEVSGSVEQASGALE